MKFNPVFIEGTTLDDTWFQLLAKLHEKGRRYLITKGSYEGAYRVAFDDVSGFIHFPHQRPLSPIVPEGIPAPTNDEDIEKYFMEYLMDGNIADNEDYKYGTFIVGGEYIIPKFEYRPRNFFEWGLLDDGFIIKVPDQLTWVINHFKKYGFGTEHCWITIGYPESNFAYDIPYTNEQERKTSPCLRGLGFRIIDDENDGPTLLTKIAYRSWDLWSGFPVNMGGFTLLNEYVANELEINPGPLSFSCPSLHCYDFQLDVLKTRLGK